jgi:hypothetical protein
MGPSVFFSSELKRMESSIMMLPCGAILMKVYKINIYTGALHCPPRLPSAITMWAVHCTAKVSAYKIVYRRDDLPNRVTKVSRCWKSPQAPNDVNRENCSTNSKLRNLSFHPSASHLSFRETHSRNAAQIPRNSHLSFRETHNRKRPLKFPRNSHLSFRAQSSERGIFPFIRATSHLSLHPVS